MLLLCMLMLVSCGKKEKTGKEKYDEILTNNQQIVPEDKTKIKTNDNFIAQQEKDYTVLIYMVGSDLESVLGNGTRDIDEIAEAGIDFTKANVIAYTGGCTRWVSNIPNSSNSVLDLSIKSEKKRIVAGTGENVSMGAAGTFADFLRFARENYPAKHYGLVLWDHGAGPVWGYGNDELHDGDMLMLSELKEAMEAVNGEEAIHFDWVGFDACLMASLETMEVFAPYTDYFIGSEEMEPGSGWDYQALRILNEETDAKTIAVAIADAYKAYYEAEEDECYHPEVTVSVADLSKLGAVKEALEALGTKLQEYVDADQYETVAQIRSATKAFGLIEGEKGSDPYYYDLIDARDFAKRIREVLPAEGKTFGKAVGKLVVASNTNVEGAGGASFYYPYKNKEMYEVLSESYEQIVLSEGYMAFLEELSEYVKEETDWTLKEVEKGENEYTYTLTKQQKKDITAAYLDVNIMDGNGGGLPALTHVRLEADEDGVIHMPMDPMLLYIRADNEKNIIWGVTQLDRIDEQSRYRIDHASLSDSVNVVDVNIAFACDETKQEITVQNVMLDNEDSAFGGKSSLDLSEYKVIAFGRQGEATESYSLDDGLPLEWKSYKELGLPVSLVLNLEDSKGEVHQTEPVIIE